MKHDEARFLGYKAFYWLRQFSVDLCWFVDDTWRLLQIFHLKLTMACIKLTNIQLYYNILQYITILKTQFSNFEPQ